MPWSTIKSASMRRLAENPEVGGVVVRLMMVLQDLAFADKARGVIAGKPPRRKFQGNLKQAARYFIRLQISHLFEGLKIVQEIANDPTLVF